MKSPDGENKAVGGGMVKVRMKRNRSYQHRGGIGKPGSVITVTKAEAERLVKIGYAEKVEED